jgi:serine/threonine-protein kinase HipA
VLDVQVGKQLAGILFRATLARHKFYFGYEQTCASHQAVSLTMPVIPEQYEFDYKLHPIFDMNLPEGTLGERLRKSFSKTLPQFDDLVLLSIVGRSQIGRLQFTSKDDTLPDIPSQDVNTLLTYKGTEDLFESLLERYAVHSGISGIQPKVLIRANASTVDRVTYSGATHIVKAWHDEYPQLAANEYFCMLAAHHAKLAVPTVALSDNGKLLIVKRFDLQKGKYLGFEDFCVLNGKTSEQKYEGSYESVTKRIKDFVSPGQLCFALESFFKILALSCAIKNGDAHLKNFGVLYENTESLVTFAPAYDLVSTTPYFPKDSLALTLAGAKRWPTAKALLTFARTHCDLTESRAKTLLNEVGQGMVQTMPLLSHYMESHHAFKEVGAVMLEEWREGLSLSIQLSH